MFLSSMYFSKTPFSLQSRGGRGNTQPGAGSERLAGAVAPQGAGSEYLARVSAPPRAASEYLAGSSAPPGAGSRYFGRGDGPSGADPGPRRTLELIYHLNYNIVSVRHLFSIANLPILL